MKFYLAPMEGITGFIYRNAYKKTFKNIDKYFTPFVVPNRSKSFKTKELRDLLPENNEGIYIVPQILTNDAGGFIRTARKLQQLGYNEVNLNLGCPSGTVVSKGRGSGFLAFREELDKFLEEIFTIEDMKLSIKTRIGKDNPEEFYELIKIYNKYPMEELIIHPRTQKDGYKNVPDMKVFKDAIEMSTNYLCYNGDIFTSEKFEKLQGEIPAINTFMVGRGLLANPGLISEIKNHALIEKSLIRAFHDEIMDQYMKLFNDETITLFRMKELWNYMIYIFSDSKKYLKRIKKSQKLKDYKDAVNSLFNEQEIIKGAGLFSNHF